MSTYLKLIKQHQASSLKRVLQEALEYHFGNFVELEKLAEPFGIEDGGKIEDAVPRMHANSNIKFEIQAYLLQFRRLRHFIHYLQNNGGFVAPTQSELRTIWDDLMTEQGLVNLLANKWAAHRSVDDPRGESDEFHLIVLVNLEGDITMWGNGHLYLTVDNREFYLFGYHKKVMRFIEWVFIVVENNSCRKTEKSR